MDGTGRSENGERGVPSEKTMRTKERGAGDGEYKWLGGQTTGEWNKGGNENNEARKWPASRPPSLEPWVALESLKPLFPHRTQACYWPWLAF